MMNYKIIHHHFHYIIIKTFDNLITLFLQLHYAFCVSKLMLTEVLAIYYLCLYHQSFDPIN